MTPVINVAIVGATGRVGSSIVPALLDSSFPKFRLTALTRPDSMKKPSTTRLVERGVRAVEIDIDGPQDNLVSAMAGIDIVVCILPPDSTRDQIPLADAALKAGVKRFVPNMWSSSCPPKGVMKIRDWKEDIINHIKKINLPYTVIDTGFWHEIMIPRVASGKLDRVALYSVFVFIDGGNVPCATIHIDDIGKYVARILADPRTVNSMVFAYGEITTQAEAIKMAEELTGEDVPRMDVTIEQTARAIRSDELDIWPQVILEYAHSAWGRGDNRPEVAKYLGYLNAKDLYPDVEILSLKKTIQDILVEGNDNPGIGAPVNCDSIAVTLKRWE